MRTDLALNHLAFLARVDEFNRIFEADNVQAAGLVEMIDHRGKCCGLAGTGRTRDENHTLMVVAKIFQNMRHIELVQCWDVPGYVAKHGANSSHLAKHVDSKAAAFLRDIGKVEILACFETLALLFT